uniref:Orn/DAP/Arg decarboxylase 2 N-terminal domain-containing protein n=1 Tax=Pelusios castaneus TaxID=367368 RepID=A0A8C8S3Y1_9SAUR
SSNGRNFRQSKMCNDQLQLVCGFLFPLSTDQIAAVINSALDLYFPEGCGVEIIAEPGRYYITSIFTLTVNVIDKEEIPLDRPGSDGSYKKSILYYLNDGISGSFSYMAVLGQLSNTTQKGAKVPVSLPMSLLSWVWGKQ